MVKDPDDIRDVTWNWADDLGSDTIASTQWIVTLPDGTPTNTLTASGSNDATTTTTRITGGTPGQKYRVTNRVRTQRGQQFDWTLKIRVRDR